MTEYEYTREEIDLWDRIVVAHTGCPGAGEHSMAIRFADKIIEARRKRFKSKNGEGPYR